LYLGLDGKRIFEAESDKIRGLDTDAFLAVANTIVPETGDIKVPDGGFTLGMKGNAELAKFQKFLYTKLKSTWKTVVVYVNFAAKNGDGKAGSPIGDYGKTTAALIMALKEGLDKPVWQETNGSRGDGNTISAEFVKRMQTELKSISESTETITYLGLDGVSLINEDLTIPASAATVSTTRTAKPQVKTQTKASTSTNTAGVVGPLPSDTNKAWRYKVVKGQWHGIDTSDKSDTYGLIRNPKYIAALMAAFPNQGGHYLRMKKVNGAWSGMDKSAEVIGYTRKNNKWYISPVGGGSTEVPAGSQVAIDLDREYVNTKYVSGTSSSGVVTPAMIDNEIVKLGNEIKQFVENGANFKAYSAGFWSGGDDELGAWDNVLEPKWNSIWKPKVADIRTKIKSSTMINSTDKGRYENSLKNIETMFTNKDFTGQSFRNKFLGRDPIDDTWDILLLLSVNGKNSDKITIDTDYEYEE
jgi:hypothetical protein